MSEEKLTTWVSEPTIQDMDMALMAASPEYIEHTSKVNGWLSNLNVTTKQGTNAPKNSQRSTIIPKVIRKHAEWRYASLSEPFHTSKTLFDLTPVSFEDTAIVEQDAAVLAHQFNNYVDRIKLIDDSVRTAVDEGTILYQVGWDFKVKQELRPVMYHNGESEEQIGEEAVEIIEHSKPTVTIIDYDAAIIDPMARGDIDDAKYVIIKYFTSIIELEEKGGFSNLDLLEPGKTISFGTSQVFSNAFEDKKRNDIEIMEYWGYWDIEDNGTLVPIVITFAQGKMLKMELSPYPDGKLPFVLVHYLPVRKSNYGEPDGMLLTDSQQITGAVTRGIIDLLGKSANGQIGYKANALDAANTLRMQRGEDYVFRSDIDPKEIMYQHQYPEIPNAAINMITMQQQEAESLTGVNTFGQGVSGASLGNGSAASAQGAINYAAKRESGMLRRLASGLEKVAKKIILMNHEFLEPDYVTSVTNKPYVEPKDDHVLVDVKVAIRTAEADNASANDLAFLLQTIGNTLDPSFTQLIVSKIAKLKGLPDLAEEIANYKPAPDPMQQEIAQLQLETAKADLQLITMKIETEKNKARQIGAEADRTNLEFVEEETGTNHARQLELLSKQAEANMYHAALKAKLGGKP